MKKTVEGQVLSCLNRIYSVQQEDLSHCPVTWLSADEGHASLFSMFRFQSTLSDAQNT